MMNTKPDVFCLECGSVDVFDEVSPFTHTVKGREVRVEKDRHVRCRSCGDVSYPGELLPAFMKAVADQIRVEDGLLSSSEMRAIRLRYGFTQEQMEKLIGAGEKTWVRWERAKVVQSHQYDAAIRRLSEDPEFVRTLMDDLEIDNHTARRVASDAVKRSKQRVIDEISQDKSIDASVQRIVDYAFTRMPAVAREAFASRLSGETQAETIRKHTRTFPVDIEAIALDLGLAVYRDPGLGKNISGRIQKDTDLGGESGYSVWVNSKEVSHRQNFTLAHEVSHFLLHRDKIGDGISEDAMHRGPFVDDEERAANALAADILMPKEVVLSQFQKSKNIEELAKFFDVSKDAMRIQLERLRLVEAKKFRRTTR